ncbi:MAG: SPOR domain-containing protein [Gammaproteobacteria bacterium]|nr:SPOR domain-containing protein [Gammaproteobacteria bacterium]
MSKKSFRLVLIVTAIFTSGLYPSSIVANDYQRAVAATKAGNYDEAVTLWKKLAAKGNPVAQYNLAVFYREGYGVDSDKSESTKWYKVATKQRLISATDELNSDSVKPARESDIQRVERSRVNKTLSDMNPVGWVLNQNPRNYTLQLASSRSEKHVIKYYNENQMQGKGGYYKKIQDGETWYFLIYGSFDSVASASDEIEQLPEEIRKWSPWVRRLGNIQKVIKQTGL